MKFENDQLFHIYNQGNNRRDIFFEEENYYFFLWKMRTHLLPFGDLVSYCLMPNHFHWQFYVREVEIAREKYWEHTDTIELQRRQIKYGNNARPVQRKANRDRKLKTITLNESISILLRSYTRAIEKPRDWSGSLFRNRTQAKSGIIEEFVTLIRSNGQLDPRFQIGTNYRHHCFYYIHNNPVVAGLVAKPEDWPFSSARDYAGLRNGTLCNLKLGKEIIKNL